MPSTSFRFDVLLMGDKGVGKSCLLLRETDDSFTTSFIHTIGIDFRDKTYHDLDATVRIWDIFNRQPPGKWNHTCHPSLIFLVYDVTDEQSFQNIRNLHRQVVRSKGDEATIILLGNKSDNIWEKVVEHSRGQALADELSLPFFEVSAKENLDVNRAFRQGISNEIARLRGHNSAVIDLPAPQAPQATQQAASTGIFASFMSLFSTKKSAPAPEHASSVSPSAAKSLTTARTISTQKVTQKIKKEAKEAKEEVPNEYLCAITSELMADPVIVAGSGQSYERSAIENWFKNNDKDPKTGIMLSTTEKKLIPNFALKNLISDWKQSHPSESKAMRF